MKKYLFTLSFMAFALLAFAQMPKKAALNRNLGFLMYKSERASWVGSDLLYVKYPHLYKQAGGYVSYTKNDTSTCIFYSLNNPDVPVIRFHFDPTFKASRVRVDTTILDLTENEKTLIAMRIKADKDVRTDTLYKHYKNTNYNIVPLIYGNQRKVFILTAPLIKHLVLFGNDYEITFDSKLNIKNRKKLHKNLIPLQNADSAVSSMHSHLKETGEFFTPTDICTLLLYGPVEHWNQHVLMSRNYVSIWNCKQNLLAVFKKRIWDKMTQSEKP